jgi:6-phosphogluconolactonase
MEIATARTADGIARLAAGRIAGWLGAAIDERGAAHLAVSGGTTPGPMLRALSTLGVAWSQVHVWQVDERVAPEGSAQRNLTGLRSDLLSRVRLPAAQVHAMPVGAADVEAAARSYGDALQGACGGVLDVVHLGLGDDGHTASWPPRSPVLRERTAPVAVTSPFHGVARMTLTPVAVNRARDVLFLVTGVDKAQVVAQLLGGNRLLPASRVRADHTVLMAGGGAEAGTVPWSQP